jgi:L-threonylcarbamoyladenylate synthase
MTASDADYQRAVDLLRAGELVAIPTETVYGLGADAANPAAVAKIFAAKGRPADHPLIVHLAGHDAVDHWAEQVPAVAWELMETFWPGPLTLILKKQAWVPDAVTGGQDTVGLRVPGHPVALELLRRFAAVAGEHAGIAAPSANRFGRISPTTAEHVAKNWASRAADSRRRAVQGRHRIDHRRLLARRAGRAASRPHLAAASRSGTRPSARPSKPPRRPRVSGSLEAHYAPTDAAAHGRRRTPARFHQRPAPSRRPCAVISANQPPQAGMPHAWRLMPADPVGYAHDLYAALRDMDHAGVDLIVVEALPDGAEWAAVADRLRRAAGRFRAEA